MTIKYLDDGTSYRKAHAHDYENPDCRILGKCDVFLKIDGIRAFTAKDGSKVSRASKPLQNLNHLTFDDAEIFHTNWNTTFSIVSSFYHPITLDQSNVYELTDGKVDQRLHLGKCTNPSNANLKKLMEEKVALGHEGLIVRCVNKKGVILWWKIVPYKNADIRITGVKEGTGKYKGMLGSLTSNHGNCGSFNDGSIIGIGGDIATRKYLWANRASIVGKIIQVRYRETTEAGKLRFPSLVKFRDDKDEESLD